ncbi:hypothetical protein SAMN05414139_03438 [Burkholderia sp. D7]|nr:hypothetical protein SAMN05414139_03438 [Burkholderia sp. D7]
MYQFVDLQVTEAKLPDTLFNQLVKLILDGTIDWSDSHVMIDEVQEAKSATVLASESSSGAVLIKGAARSEQVGKALSALPQITVKTEVEISKGNVYSVVAKHRVLNNAA